MRGSGSRVGYSHEGGLSERGGAQMWGGGRGGWRLGYRHAGLRGTGWGAQKSHSLTGGGPTPCALMEGGFTLNPTLCALTEGG